MRDQFSFQIGDLGDGNDFFDVRVRFYELNIVFENVQIVYVSIEDQNNDGFGWQFTEMCRFNVFLNRIQHICLPRENKVLPDQCSDEFFLAFAFDIILDSGAEQSHPVHLLSLFCQLVDLSGSRDGGKKIVFNCIPE